MTSPTDLREKVLEAKLEKKLKTNAIFNLLSDYERSTVVLIYASDKVVFLTDFRL
jgi:hypothetical protein|tara:strand:- start:18 stop:182 length:165 start_codon:yes stop_codon:yes gene_type:complete